MYRIGIDLGGTNIAAGLVNEQFEIVAQDSTPTLVGRPNEELVADIVALLQSPAKNVISALQGAAGQKIAGLVKTLEERNN